MTGKRADLIIGDDIETPNNSETKMMREKISVKTEEFASLLTPNEESEVVYLGTPQVKQSLYNKLPDRGYAVRIWPGRYPSSKLAAYFGEMLAPTIQLDLEKHPELAGQPAEPVRFSESVLFEKEAEMGRSTFQLQMMLNTAMSDAEKYPLKLSDLIFMSLNPEIAPQKVVWASSPDLIINDLPNVGMNGDKMYRPMHIQSSDWLNYTGSIMAIDPSGRGKDETGYAIIKALNGYLYLLDVGGFSYCYSNETLEGLVQVAKQYKVNKIIYEANYGDGMFGSLLKPILNQQYPCTMEEIHSKGQKEKRIIDTLEPIMNQHRLVVDLTLIEKDFKSVDKLASHLSNTIKPQYRFFYQLTRITRDKAALKHDDRLEAVSMAVSYWTDALALDADRQIENTKQKLLEDELNHFKANVFGLQTQLPKTWVDY